MEENRWTVVASWTDDDGENHCQVFSEGHPSREAAEAVADQMRRNMGVQWDGSLEVATTEDAEQVVTE